MRPIAYGLGVWGEVPAAEGQRGFGGEAPYALAIFTRYIF